MINFYIAFFTISVIAVYIFFKNYLKISKKFKLIDNKNPHYNNRPTPTGSGIIFSIFFVIANLLFFIFLQEFENKIPNRYYIFLIASLCLSIISFKDDQKSIDPIIRLISQIFLIYISIVVIDFLKFDFPLKLSVLFSVIIWIYIMNISNFIDGTDGFLILNFIFVLLNIITFKIIFNIDLFSFYISIIILPCCLVFFLFNKPPAKIYMGDAGSIFIGFLNGFFFLELFSLNYINLSISIFSYMLIDCTITLIKKVRRGYMPWVGLYDYYFLMPVLKNKKYHKKILYIIFISNLLNTFFIYFQLQFDVKFLFIFNLLIAFLTTKIFYNLGNKKIKK